MKKNLSILSNNNTNLYNLNCFIDDNYNVYFKNHDWFKYNNKGIENGDEYYNKNPKVLFYKIMDEKYNNINIINIKKNSINNNININKNINKNININNYNIFDKNNNNEDNYNNYIITI